MNRLVEQVLGSSLHDVFSDVDLNNLLGDRSPAARHGLVKRAGATGELLLLRRGLYLLADPHRRSPLQLLPLAGRVYAPSYVSLESALSFHGWIPERVVVVTSASFKRSTVFDTPVGRFEYQRTPIPNLLGVSRKDFGEDAALLASPLRALVDLWHARPQVKGNVEYLTESLRIDSELLRALNVAEFERFTRALAKGRAARQLAVLRKELGK